MDTFEAVFADCPSKQIWRIASVQEYFIFEGFFNNGFDILTRDVLQRICWWLITSFRALRNNSCEGAKAEDQVTRLLGTLWEYMIPYLQQTNMEVMVSILSEPVNLLLWNCLLFERLHTIQFFLHSGLDRFVVQKKLFKPTMNALILLMKYYYLDRNYLC